MKQRPKPLTYAEIRARANKNPGSVYLAQPGALPKLTKGDSHAHRRRTKKGKEAGPTITTDQLHIKRNRVRFPDAKG